MQLKYVIAGGGKICGNVTIIGDPFEKKGFDLIIEINGQGRVVKEHYESQNEAIEKAHQAVAGNLGPKYKMIMAVGEFLKEVMAQKPFKD